jgi:GNAT superfamily N-acetyltransferase
MADGELRFGPDYAALHHLTDGTRVRLRLLRADDREPLVTGFDHLSPQSRYRRFFTSMPRLPESMIRRLLNVDGDKHLAIVAEAANETDEPQGFWGIARYARLPDEPAAAEAAVAVADPLQRRGLGKLLLTELASAARERGVTHFRAEVQLTNEPMKALLRELDANARPTLQGSLAVYDVSLPEPGEEAGPLFRFLKAAAAEGLSFVLRRFRGKRAGRAPEPTKL